MLQTMDGNAAAAHVSYALSEVAAIFPITPSSPMAEQVDEWAAHGKKNLFGQPVKVVEMQSEGGAAGAVHGALQGGALTVTYTSAQGLMLMLPNMYRIAGELLPAVFHVSARALANNAWSVFGEHQDVMAARQTGFAIIASSSVQDVMDFAAVAHLAALRSRVPFLHFFDGFRTSHEAQKISVIEYEDLDKLIDRSALAEFKAHALSPDHPVHRGLTQNPDVFFQMREAVNPWYERLPSEIEHCMRQIGDLTGRHHGFFDYHGAPDAERVIMAMGSSCSVIEETVDYLTERGEKVGLVNVHVFRPFCSDRLLSVLPKTVKKIAVLDRTKESGAGGEPLYVDVRSALYDAAASSGFAPMVVGGRYGLGAKNFSPSDVLAVYDNLEQDAPKNGFTVSIDDDVTCHSLPVKHPDFDPTPLGITACKFWGLGSDGTVSANKSAVKIIGDHTSLYAQAYFAYDSKKSGGVTISHLRFGTVPIKSSYYVQKADFVACHNQAYIGKYDMTSDLKEGGCFLLNTLWTPDDLPSHLSAEVKRTLERSKVRLYTLNAVKIAQELGLGSRINMIMQAAFFKLICGDKPGMIPLPLEDALKYLKDAVVESYGRQGEAVVKTNFTAIDRALSDLVKIDIPSDWKDAQDAPAAPLDVPDFIARFVEPINRQEGDKLPVSVMRGHEDGTFPVGTSAWEKRGIAVNVPVWRAERCVQCNQCSFICPHAALRPLLATDAELAGAPAGLLTRPAVGVEAKHFHLAISTLDCTGCGNCLDVCPAKEKALEMRPLEEVMPEGAALWDFAASHISYKPVSPEAMRTVKGSQFARPLLEFSGACAGCGETPYVKLLTQLYGDRMYIQNPSGCTTVWGGSCPAVPYTVNDRGHGPTFAYSLFEDCGEYGFGIHIGATQVRERVALQVEEALRGDLPSELRAAMKDWLDNRHVSAGTRDRADRLTAALGDAGHSRNALLDAIYERRDFFVRKAQWIVGGDGWAYDIGYGGLDHVLASGEDLNVLVVDTEVYSNTGGQSSKATQTAAVAGFAASGKRTRKKDLGMMMLSYGNIYVAQVAMGADRSQTLKAFIEAEAYPGPSIVIAYCPCINHGISAGMGHSQEQQKRAVEAGYWGLYRYNPLLKAEGKNPFTLDSRPPVWDNFKEFLRSEVRFSSLERQFPDAARVLFEKCEEDAKERLGAYQRLAATEPAMAVPAV
ncbi:MAG: pyruvate:ferredoxin (flavodoxin) oxidoreductase [Synergistaceae bacterium]|jgi:pyruvate-ferredoxin/flavodoxin oxidoreductase|nr:pyruvate:ferredoxin (flavodoxin) oxidoreductase [Synergistaceae bacterium]